MNDKVDSNLDYLEMGGRKFSSRLFVGTGKFSSPEEMRYAIQASETEIVTVALRRVDLEKADDDILAAINREKVLLLPNTSGARNAIEAVLIYTLARSLCAFECGKL